MSTKELIYTNNKNKVEFVIPRRKNVSTSNVNDRNEEDNNINTYNDNPLSLNELNNNKQRKGKKNSSVCIKHDPFFSHINTSVYKYLGMIYDKTKKNANYQRICSKLKNLFMWNSNYKYLNDIEIKKDNNYQRRKSISKDIISSCNVLDYIKAIKKPPNKRTMLDLYLIVNCLSNTKLGKYFKEEFDGNKEVYEKLITFCGVEIQYKKYFSGEKIFNIGDLPDNFYIILQGKIDIVKPQLKKETMTGKNYFCYLMDLLKEGDKYTFNLCIENNKINYIIEREDVELIQYIFVLLNLEKISLDYQVDFNEVLNIVNIPPKELGLNIEQTFDNKYIRENMDKIKKNIPYSISLDLIEKYYFIVDDNNKSCVIIYNNVKFLSLETNDYFGDAALDCNTTRNATIIASDDTDLGYLEMGLYHNNIGEEKSKLILQKINFLLKNFFFKNIIPNKFEKKYFGYFMSNNYNRGDVLFKENEMPLFVYFIEEGKVELSSHKNIFEMEKIIEILKKKRKKVNKLIMSELQTDSENEKSKESSYEEELKYNNIKNSCKELIKYMKNKEKNKLLILSEKEDLGLISFFFNCPYITDCVVSSNTAKIFKINIKYLNEIMNSEKKMSNGFKYKN